MSVGFNPCPMPYLPHRDPMVGTLGWRPSCSPWRWSVAGKGFLLGRKNTNIISAGKSSESQLAELHKIVLIYSPKSLSKAEQHLRGNNCTKV